MGQSWPESDGNEEVLCIPQSFCMTGTSPSDRFVTYPGYSLGGSYPSAEMQSVYSTAPADWGKYYLYITVELTEIFVVGLFCLECITGAPSYLVLWATTSVVSTLGGLCQWNFLSICWGQRLRFGRFTTMTALIVPEVNPFLRGCGRQKIKSAGINGFRLKSTAERKSGGKLWIGYNIKFHYLKIKVTKYK